MGSEKKNKYRGAEVDQNSAELGETNIGENNVIDYESLVDARKNRPKAPRERVAKEPKQTKEPKDFETKTSKPVSTKSVSEEKVTLVQRWKQLVVLYKNEKTTKIVGLLLILISAYLSICFVSYFLSWDVDQDKVLGGVAELFKPETKVVNWLGKIGALVSHWFMYKGFGAASFIAVPVLFTYGLQKLTQKQLINTGVFNAKWLFAMVWSSLLLAWVFSDSLFFMGGGFGYFINQKIANYVGNVGLVALLGFSMLTFLVIIFNINFSFPSRPTIEEDEEIQDELNPSEKQPESKSFNSSFNEVKDLKLTPEEEAGLLNFEVITKETTNGITEVVEKQEPAFNEVGFEVLPSAEAVSVEKQLDEHQADLTSTGVTRVENHESKGEPELEIAKPVDEPISTDDENKAAKLVEQFGEYDPTLDLGSYQFPSFDLLNDYGNIQSKVNQEELIANKNKILSTLKNYGIEIDKIMATVGPTVTLYEIVPAAGVRISKIKTLEDDIALSLAALGIRIIAPIPGRGTIGIEVPNQTPEMVPMKNILASEKFNNSQFELPIALGKTISNEIFIADLAKMPHLLMAGATGQGKSVGLNAVLVSLLYKKHPSQVKFVLVDPKKVELTLFKKIERHFLAKLPNSEDAIITDNTKVIHTLNSLCIEMDNRYALLQDAQVRNIKEYNAKFVQRKLNPNDGHKFLPYIVLVVDEFADLIMTAGKEVETPIARLAQLARAIGIHLIIATQRPSVNIITGTIKANFPARIAFRVTSKIDSRTILDSGGADQLIGRGDMLLSTGNDLIRIQCAFVDTPEVEKITDFIGNQRAYPSAFMLPEYVGEEGEGGKEEVDLSERDKMFDESAKLVVQFQQGSASFFFFFLKLGYNRAGRIVDQLEAAGIIGQFEGSKAREVLVKDMQQLEEILQKLRNR